jgi:hypothetical protein
MNDDRKEPLGSHLPDYESSHPSEAPITHRKWLADPVRRRWAVRIALALLMLVIVPPAYRGIKAWRARSLIARSASEMAAGDLQGGLETMKKGLALAPGDTIVQQAVELHNARLGDKESRDKILRRIRARASDPGEIMGMAEVESQAGDPSVARECLAQLPESLAASLRFRRSLIEARLLAREKNPEEAADFLLAEADRHPRSEAGRLRVQAALYLFSTDREAAVKKAVPFLMEVVASGSEASLDAWRLLAKAALLPSKPGSEIVTTGELRKLPGQFAGLSGTLFSDRLLAADLEIKADPSSLAKVTDRLEKKIRGGTRAERLDFARWLNAHREPDRAIDFAGGEAPRSHTDWLLVVLDAMSQKDDWKNMERMMESPAGAGIPPAVRHLYLARAAMMTGNAAREEEEWREVSGSLALEKTQTLVYIAKYQEQIGRRDKAARTYRELASRKETQVPGLLGLIRSQSSDASAASMIPMYEELIAAAPSLPEARGDLGYLRLLRERDPKEVAVLAAEQEGLLSTDPNAMARISATALARLRRGDTTGAMALYQGREIDWSVMPDSWKAVRVAVLLASGDRGTAQSLASTIDKSNLRPEERDLLLPSR